MNPLTAWAYLLAGGFVLAAVAGEVSRHWEPALAGVRDRWAAHCERVASERELDARLAVPIVDMPPGSATPRTGVVWLAREARSDLPDRQSPTDLQRAYDLAGYGWTVVR